MSVFFDEEFVLFFFIVWVVILGVVGRLRSEIDLEIGLLSCLIIYKYKVYLKMLVIIVLCI